MVSSLKTYIYQILYSRDFNTSFRENYTLYFTSIKSFPTFYKFEVTLKFKNNLKKIIFTKKRE